MLSPKVPKSQHIGISLTKAVKSFLIFPLFTSFFLIWLRFISSLVHIFLVWRLPWASLSSWTWSSFFGVLLPTGAVPLYMEASYYTLMRSWWCQCGAIQLVSFCMYLKHACKTPCPENVMYSLSFCYMKAPQIGQILHKGLRLRPRQSQSVKIVL